MKKTYIILAILFGAVIWGCEPDTSDSPDPEDVFVKLYGSNFEEVAADIIQRADGSFVILGTTNSLQFKEDKTTLDRDFYLIFADSTGNPTFQMGYDDDPDPISGGDQVATSLTELSNGDLVMSGYTLIDERGVDETLRRGLIIIVDANGANPRTMISVSNDFDDSIMDADSTVDIDEALVEFERFQTTDFFTEVSRTDPSLTPTPVEEEITSLIETNDGNLVFIGKTNDVNENKPDFDPGTDLEDVWVVKMSPADFSIIFEKQIGFPNNDRGIAIFEKSDGSLALVANGPGKDDDGTDDVLFVSSDANVNNDNFTEFTSAGGNDVVGGAVLLSDDGLAVTGTTDGNAAFVLGISSGGSELFFQAYDETIADQDLNEKLNGFASQGVAITQMNNGDLAVVGNSINVTEGDNGDNPKRQEVLFFNIDGFGNLLGNSTTQASREQGGIELTFGGNLDDSGQKIMQLSNGRFIILATIDFENGSRMIGLIKTSSRGDLIR